MKARAKVSRAIEPNAGNAKEAAKRIRRIVNAFENEYKREALKIAAKYCKPTHANDAHRFDSGLAKKASLDLVKLQARLLIKLGEKPRAVSYWFCRRLLRRVSADQLKALKEAGVSSAWLKQKWTVPVIKGQYISKAAAAKIPEHVDWAASLITRMCEASAKKVQNAIAEGVEKGHSLSRLTERINALENMDDARAARVALDQSCKLNQFVQVENAKAIGVTEGIWIHVPGQFESRLSHMKMNGKRFKLSKGMFDPEVDAYVQPAELPFCRCCFRAVLPDMIRD